MANAGKGVKEKGYTVGENVRQYTRGLYWGSQNVKTRSAPWPSYPTSGCLSKGNEVSISKRCFLSPVCCSAGHSSWGTQPARCPQADKRQCASYVYTPSSGMGGTKGALTETSQTGKDKRSVFPPLWGSSTQQPTWIWTSDKQRLGRLGAEHPGRLDRGIPSVYWNLSLTPLKCAINTYY